MLYLTENSAFGTIFFRILKPEPCGGGAVRTPAVVLGLAGLVWFGTRRGGAGTSRAGPSGCGG